PIHTTLATHSHQTPQSNLPQSRQPLPPLNPSRRRRINNIAAGLQQNSDMHAFYARNIANRRRITNLPALSNQFQRYSDSLRSILELLNSYLGTGNDETNAFVAVIAELRFAISAFKSDLIALATLDPEAAGGPAEISGGLSLHYGIMGGLVRRIVELAEALVEAPRE
ncbi:MAG: hypothetical protein Q9183_006831, partial [Haloplaca sp. 2 TL-2023]